jgi:tRNA-uridine 2-sulfurtransferase
VERVVLAMSGGVDSSVAAHLLVEQGYDVIGVFMRHGEESSKACHLDLLDRPNALNLPIVQARSDHKQGCCSASDALDARRVADRLKIPFFALDMQADFRRIVDYFVDEYNSGRTPNPCVQCNNWIKFGALFDYADAVDARYVATGHYAQLQITSDGELGLYRGIDDRKDQSYVLAGIDRQYLPRMMLPIGGYAKPRIRELAAIVGLNVADKKDSQEICFVTSGHHGQFVRDRSNAARSDKGRIVTSEGVEVGFHDGIESYTIGQRKGLGVAMFEPYFVVKIDAQRNEVVIGKREELQRKHLQAVKCNWLTTNFIDTGALSVQIRYNASSHPAQVVGLGEQTIHVTFDSPVDAVAPGQLAVVFDGQRVLGGGWIETAS